MTEISLHILDIVQNSIAAHASLIRITINEDLRGDVLTIEITDDGKGMTKEELKLAADPYFTSRTTRKVGLGLSLFKQAVEQCSGSFSIDSQPGVGTKVTASLQYAHIDRQPLGDMAGVVSLLASSNPSIDFIYKHISNKNEFMLDTREIKEQLDGISIANPKVKKFIREMIQENLNDINN